LDAKVDSLAEYGTGLIIKLDSATQITLALLPTQLTAPNKAVTPVKIINTANPVSYPPIPASHCPVPIILALSSPETTAPMPLPAAIKPKIIPVSASGLCVFTALMMPGKLAEKPPAKRLYINEKTHSIGVEAAKPQSKKTEAVASRLDIRMTVVTSRRSTRKPIVTAPMTEVEATTVPMTFEKPNERAYVGR
jgi:hypothetical protein